MFKKIKQKIEEKRNSKNIFWKGMVFSKDFIWKFLYKEISFKPTLEWNKCWNTYDWKKNGDEWDNQAAFCNQPYKKWKKSIVDNFIYKNIDKNSIVLEIAPGHGRWTEFILKKAEETALVDVNKKCIDFCKKRFSKFKNIKYYVNDGRRLDFIKNNSVDFIFSYDSFVHMEKNVIDSYFKEFSRILKPNGKVIIHHAGKKRGGLVSFLDKLGIAGKIIYWLFYLDKSDLSGERSNISKKMIEKIVKKYNLKIVSQVNSWGKNNEYNCKLFNDYISEIAKK